MSLEVSRLCLLRDWPAKFSFRFFPLIYLSVMILCTQWSLHASSLWNLIKPGPSRAWIFWNFFFPHLDWNRTCWDGVFVLALSTLRVSLRVKSGVCGDNFILILVCSELIIKMGSKCCPEMCILYSMALKFSPQDKQSQIKMLSPLMSLV